MRKNKLHKIDLIFIIGITIIGMFAGFADYACWKDVEYGGFPVFSCISVFASYILWIILLIYSNIKCKHDKLQIVKWYMYFVLPFLHVIFAILGCVIAFIIL